jgi:hypothetical protein
MKALRIAFFAAVVTALAISHSAAVPPHTLLLTAYGNADMSGSPLDVTYATNPGSFYMTGSLSDYITSANTDTMDSGGYGDYYLAANINTSGILSGGVVTNIASTGPITGILLTGVLETGAAGTVWGYDNNSSVDQFSFLFKVTGGSQASNFGGINAVCGVNLFADFAGNSGHDVAFNGTWGSQSGFNNQSNNNVGSGNGSADIFRIAPVPEPSTMALMLGGGLALLAIRRRGNARFPIKS